MCCRSAARESAGAADAKEGMPGRLLGGVALLLWAAAAAAFLPPRPAVHRARRAAAVRASPLEDIELTRLFGRLAEKRLLLDVPMAGTAELRNCCHGGCDNCDFSRVFDEMSAGKPKWIPLYVKREFEDGRSAVSTWSTMFEGDELVNAAAFVDRFKKLPFTPPMGAKKALGAADDIPSDEAVLLLWTKMAGAAGVDPTAELCASDMAAAMAEITKKEHGAMFSEFELAMAM